MSNCWKSMLSGIIVADSWLTLGIGPEIAFGAIHHNTSIRLVWKKQTGLEILCFYSFFIWSKKILPPNSLAISVFMVWSVRIFHRSKTYHLDCKSLKLASIVALYSRFSIKAMINHSHDYFFHGLSQVSLSKLFLACFHRQLGHVRSLRHPNFVIQWHPTKSLAANFLWFTLS